MNALHTTGHDVTEYKNSDGDVAYIGAWVDNVQVVGAVRHAADRWHIWSTSLSLNDTSPLTARDERSARVWVNFIADLTEKGTNR